MNGGLSKESPMDDPSEFQKWKEKMDRVHGLAGILVEKHRHGPTAKVILRFEKQFTRFLAHPGVMLA